MRLSISRGDYMTVLSNRELYELVSQAYGDPMPRNYALGKHDAYNHDMGDGLASFIIIETLECVEGETTRIDQLKAAIAAMEKAGAQIGDVLNALMTELEKAEQE